MARLANKVVKAMMQCTVDDATESGRRPNRTVNGLGAMVMLRVCESVLKCLTSSPLASGKTRTYEYDQLEIVCICCMHHFC